MKKIIISAGPMPAKLDSVKIITNMFKGGLVIKTAEELAACGDFDVEMVKWRGTPVKFRNADSAERIRITDVGDLYEYLDYIVSTPADAYIMAAAVANLAPVNPWEGKFPSHHYKVGEEFDIRFTIAPRIIDEVKKHHPRSTLVGYKLFDGLEEELIAAGWETLCGSRANVVFCNHPATAKTEKIAVMPDGTMQKMTFDEHVEFMKRVIMLEWYATTIRDESFENAKQQELDALLSAVGEERPPYVFGTVALRDGDGFITTTRGKQGTGYCKVYDVDHAIRTVYASEKATMNAPFIERLLVKFPWAQCVVHGHRHLTGVTTLPYCFSGTTEETALIEAVDVSCSQFNVEHHGYYAMFNTLTEAQSFAGKLSDNV